jgi:cell division protein FtsI (penicillin-binding protein 3)
MKRQRPLIFLSKRFTVVLIILGVVFVALIARMLFLTVIERKFLTRQGNVRMLRTVNIPAYRGMILDRNRQPLAMNIPVDAIWINPQDFPMTWLNLYKVSKILKMPLKRLQHIIHRNRHRQFVYIQRSATPATAKKIDQLTIPGLYFDPGYRRFYPAGAMISQVLGRTNIDNRGQSGLELAYNNWLKGVVGKRQVLKDRLGHIVAVVDQLKSAKPGRNLVLSINRKIQFLSYRVLKKTVEKYHAETGSVVVMNPKTGEILAMTNYPSFDPNEPYRAPYARYRNRAVTDMYEPGSTMKAFSIANALEIGGYTPKTTINTHPGILNIDGNIVRDDGLDYGVITVRQVLQKSSNVGVAKMTIHLPPEHLVGLLRRVGFGSRTDSGFPGESTGTLRNHRVWRPFVLATLAFGYGIAITPLQLAAAYSVIANNGLKCPVTFLKRKKIIICPRAMKEKVAHEMLKMLTAVVQWGGTGHRAIVPGYHVAGKTGTAYIAGKHGYDEKHHVASFVGTAPVTNPRLVVAVVVRDPKGKTHFGGVIAAPAFSKIMGGSLRILNVLPDNLPKT